MKSYAGKGFKRRLVGLGAPPLLLALADTVLTLLGQSSAYWSDYRAVNEAGPLFAGMLQLHPVAAVLTVLFWMLLFETIIVTLPQRLALIVSIAVTLAHTFGSGTWLFNHFELGYQLANVHFLLSACVLGTGIQYAMARGTDDKVLLMSEQARWKLGGGAFAIGAMMFLVPW